ncbi:MAG: Rne/Rng family ribonuclease [Propionibacteriaceae bacterium]|jgi:ribonuclease E|nr:Rne/Rng family ribonuclease [Propionibacteriaceae bacterium]
MLDQENNVTVSANDAPEAAAPPVRRRSARAAKTEKDSAEPANIPADATAPQAAATMSRQTSRRRAAASAVAEPAPLETPSEAPEVPKAAATAQTRRSGRSRRAATAESGETAADAAAEAAPASPPAQAAAAYGDEISPAAEEPAPRRRARRSAAASPAENPAVLDAHPVLPDSPADAATAAEPSAASASPAPVLQPAAPARRSRRAAAARTGSVAAETAAQSEADPVPVVLEAETPAAAPVADFAAPAPVSLPEAPAADTGSQAADTRPQAVDTVSPDPDSDAAAPALPLSPDSVPTAKQAAEPRGARRRLRNRASAAVDDEPPLENPWPTGDADPIAAALDELSQARRRQDRDRPVPPVAESLSDLAAAIAQESESGPIGESLDVDDLDAGSGENRRRRRRRGGRRHRKGAGDEDAAEAGDGETAPDVSDAPEAAEDEGESDGHRRRRRRRRGEETSSDDETGDGERVREPRSQRSANEVTGITGSTRLEAKRQRRREGRAASRRRAPVISEAEFLARRESVARTMVIRQGEDYSQIAVLEDGILVEHYVDRAEATSLIGNIYLGRVQNVLPSMEAVFFDIGRGRNAVLFAGEVDWDAFGVQGQNRRVEEIFSSGQSVLVQVTKDPVGAKGARLTSHVSIPGRYVVYAPGGHLSGISRKLADTERNRLKSILDDLVGAEASVIVRTAAEGASTDELVHDINRLKAQWEVIERKAAKSSAPQLLYSEPDLTMRIVRDLFTEDFAELIVDGGGGLTDAYETVQAYLKHVAPQLADRTRRWDRGQGDLFAFYRLDEQIAKALDRKVHLPSGGTLIIDRTEAMTVIDVNTGKFTGSGGTLEATVTSNNLEAAEEIVRQLRLRDVGGIIVIDFIDMVLPANRDLLLRRLVECLGRDRTRHQVSEVTSLGLVQMTRKRVGTGLAEAFTRPCEQCGGLGYHRVSEPIDNPTPPDGGERQRGRGRH